MVEGALAPLELPAPVPLRAPGVGESLQRLVVRDLNGVALDDHVEPVVPAVAAGRQDHVRVGAQVDGLLLGVAGAEVEGAVEPDRDERGDVWSPGCTDGGDPEQLRRLDGFHGVVPRGCRGGRVTEPAVERGLRCTHRDSSHVSSSTINWSMRAAVVKSPKRLRITATATPESMSAKAAEPFAPSQPNVEPGRPRPLGRKGL